MMMLMTERCIVGAVGSVMPVVCRLVCCSVTVVRCVTMVITDDDVKLAKVFHPSTHQFTAATAGDRTTELYIPSPLRNNTGRFFVIV